MQVASRLTVAIIATVIMATASSTLAFAAPAAWDTVDVTVHAEQGNAIMLVSGKLPDDSKLPAEVELSVPAGSAFQWAGEILGGPVDEDPSVQYTMTTEGGSDIYSFRLSESRIGQLEVVSPNLLMPTADGYQSNLAWTAMGDVKELRLSYRLPQTAKIVAPASGATLEPGPSGYGYYSRIVSEVKAGQTESLAFAYSDSAPAAASGSSASTTSDTLVPVLLLGATMAFFGILAFRVSRKIQAKSSGASSSPRSAVRASNPSPGSPGGSDGRAKKATLTDPVEEPPIPAGAGREKPVVVLALVFGVIGVVAMVALLNGGKAAVSGDTVMLSVAQVDACTTSSIPLTTPAGGDLARDANDILGLLKSVPGVGNATIHLSQSVIQVDYCESSTSEAKIRAGLAPSGYVSASSTVSTTTAPASAQ